MAAFAWYYGAEHSVYYWTESYTMSATQFAIAVSERIGRTITASDLHQCLLLQSSCNNHYRRDK